MNDPRPGDRDKLDELYDQGLSELYRGTPDVEPPIWLDQRILAAARTAMEKPRLTPAIPWFRWHHFQSWTAPVAVAATVVLAVGLLHWLPPASAPGGMPAALEEKMLPSQAKPAAEQDAEPAKSLPSTAPVAGARRMAPPAAPAPESPAAEMQRREQRFQPAPPAEEAPRKADRRALKNRWTPAEWRAEIARLRRQGREAEAQAVLVEFRRQYPDEPLEDAAKPPR